jgi:predicted solute-binding protein
MKNSRFLKLGAVNYLNMLPFFYRNPTIKLFTSPKNLNDAMRVGALDAACMSLSAGTELNLTALPFGIFGTSKVLSVLLYPLNNSAVACMNEGLVYNFNTIDILYSGASEQSIFMSQKIFRKKFPTCEIETLADETMSSLSILEMKAKVMGFDNPHFYLCIGDEAIFRSLTENECEHFDVAALWSKVFSTPAQFASWFVRPEMSAADCIWLQTQICESLLRWQLESQYARNEAILRYAKQSLVLKEIDEDKLLNFAREYFAVLRFVGQKTQFCEISNVRNDEYVR